MIELVLLLGSLWLAPPPPADSLYALEIGLIDAQGRPTPLDVFRGEPVLVAMFYASCPTMCPLLIQDLQRVDRRAGEAGARPRVLMVSFDSARDDPAALRALAERHALGDPRWLLTAAADPGAARLLAAALGVRYRPIAGGHFAHDSVIALLDAEGRLVARLEGAGASPTALLERLRALPP